MRILLLAHAFNSLTQRLFVELRADRHEVAVELDVNDAVTEEGIALFEPDLVVAPYLRRAIPASVWQRRVCLVVHPGPPGDRGPASLDRAIFTGATDWGVTVLQAEAELDAGPVWAAEPCRLRPAPKSSLYRNEITEAAVRGVRRAIAAFPSGAGPRVAGELRPALRQAERRVDWRRAPTATVLRAIRASDSSPGVRDEIDGRQLFLYDARPADGLGGAPGAIVARRGTSIARATADGAVWIGQLRDPHGEHPFKLPATRVIGEEALAGVREVEGDDEIEYTEADGVGVLRFPFYNGAMGTAQCERLRAAYMEATRRPTRVIVLAGGPDFYSNGLHLNLIEAADSPAEESWRNIVAMDDLAHAIIVTESHLTVAALRGNAGAGGCFLALAADHVWARTGIVLNPHYKGMGNLYGSEYWTYLLPRRAGAHAARAAVDARLPLGTAEARRLGLLDETFEESVESFSRAVMDRARALAADPALPQRLADKRARRAADEAARPLEAYRSEELEHMKLNFYGFDTSYHVARYNFVRKVPKSRTPLAIAPHRRSRPAAGPADR